MSTILDFEESPGYKDINKGNLLKHIWFRPADSLNYLLKIAPGYKVALLFLLGGAINGLDNYMENSESSTSYKSVWILGAVIGGAIIGYLGYYIYAWAMSKTGKWMGGTGSSQLTRTALAWSLLPIIASVAFLVPYFFLDIAGGFQSIYALDFNINALGLIIIVLCDAALSIWSLIILIIGLKLAHEFPVWKAIICSLLPILLIAIPLVTLVLIGSDISGIFS